MAFEKKQMVLTDEPSFELVLDSACARLREKHIQYSLRRINEMEEILQCLEKELDDFIGHNASHE